MLYPKPCYNELCYKEVVVYYLEVERLSNQYFQNFSEKIYIYFFYIPDQVLCDFHKC